MPQIIGTEGEKYVTIVQKSEWRGETRLDVRGHYLPDGETEYRPTKKGVSFVKADISNLLDAVAAEFPEEVMDWVEGVVG
jgi:hypothetical protein